MWQAFTYHMVLSLSQTLSYENQHTTPKHTIYRHTYCNELLSTYTDCRWEVQKLGCPCFPSLGSKYKPMSKMEPRCGSYTSSFRHTTHTHTHIHTHAPWGHSKALLQSQRQGVSQREERDNIWIKMQSWRKRTDDQNSYTAERWWRTPRL